MKRFYERVSVETALGKSAPGNSTPGEAEAVGGFVIALDGRVVKSPAKAELVLPSKALAEAIAAEWQAQGEKIIPDSMPMMTLASTAIDRVLPQKDAVAAEAASYAASDLLCYRADAPLELVTAQSEGWDPVLNWARDRYGVSFEITKGIMPIAQPNATLMILAREAGGFEPFALTGVHTLTAALGSFVLALAVATEEVSPEKAVLLSQTDEDHQANLWGRDEEASQRRDRIEADILSAARFLQLLRVS